MDLTNVIVNYRRYRNSPNTASVRRLIVASNLSDFGRNVVSLSKNSPFLSFSITIAKSLRATPQASPPRYKKPAE